MARKRQSKREQKREFQLGDYWIGKEADNDTYYRYWYDEGKRKTRRKSLRTRDLNAAKKALAELYLTEEPENPHSPEVVSLTRVFNFYMKHHGENTKSAAASRRAFQLTKQYFKTLPDVDTPMVTNFGLAQQIDFMEWCASEKELSAKSISTYLGQVKAAINYCTKPRMLLDSRGRKREIRVLDQTWDIQDSIKEICLHTDLDPSQPRWTPKKHEMVQFLNAIESENLLRYAIIAMNTWARPGAIFDFNTFTQVDLENGSVDLNPPGRRQEMTKYRPTIPLTDNLRGWIMHWNMPRPMLRRGKPIEHLAKVVRETRERAGLPKFVLYSFRHFMGTRIKDIISIPTTRENRAEYMGHKAQTYRTTADWYEAEGLDHLVNCAKATDALMLELDRMCDKTLVSPIMHPETGLTIVSKD